MRHHGVGENSSILASTKKKIIKTRNHGQSQTNPFHRFFKETLHLPISVYIYTEI
jgi:hypothetical protein